ncbi:MAG: 3-isopropylmalate dehydratase small subunit [Gemmatimonadaceae bacterium]
MSAFPRFSSRLVALPTENVDTDQIIPARFLKTTDRTGLGTHLFADWRYDASGAPRPDFPLNRATAQGAQLLVAGRNFGCGSSREHAVWALIGCGLRAVISPSFADIFRGNALKNGLLPIVVSEDMHRILLGLADESPAAVVSVDLDAQELILPGRARVSFPIDGFAKRCLLEGTDELGFLLAAGDAITAFESARVPRVEIQR